MRAFEPVFIEWIDSCGTRGDWIDEETVKEMKPCVIQSVGWVYKEDEFSVTIFASSSDRFNQFEGVLNIPKISIINRHRIIFTYLESEYEKEKANDKK